MTIPRKNLAIGCALGAAVFSMIVAAQADQVEMQNGDRYNGKVLTLNADTVMLRSDVLGTLSLPRGKVALITLGTGVLPRVAAASPAPATNASLILSKPAAAPAATDADINSALRQLGSNTNLIQQVQAQFLGSAGPEANKKFTEMLGGLSSGKMGIDDLRTQAKAAADQLRSLKRELGDGGDSEMDGYLSILEDFLKETAPAGVSGAGGAVQAVQSTKEPADQQ